MSVNEQSVFAEALEIQDPETLAAFLDRVCAGNPELRKNVESLLSAYSAGEFLEAPALVAVSSIDTSAFTERPGTVIGPYKLLEQIGEGGFGVVFMAEQQQPVRRKVALKVLKPGMDTKQVMARFEAERQALALMDHPHIAHVLDAGTTDTGRPYFVMELIRGIPITQFCDDNRLTPRERLELFLTVCQAVQHAHQKGIIHRDLKPSNVLVTLLDGTPVVKVIDFGIAKALGHERLTDKTLFTGFAQMIGTPLYMSPEQAEMSGQDVDTRTDVYAPGSAAVRAADRDDAVRQGTLEGSELRRDTPHHPRGGAGQAQYADQHPGAGRHDCFGQPQERAPALEPVVPWRAGLDRDEGVGEGSQPPLRYRQQLCGGRAALLGRRAGAGLPAVGGVSLPQVRAAKQGDAPRAGVGAAGDNRRRRQLAVGERDATPARQLNARQAQLTREVNAALNQATVLRDQAKAANVGSAVLLTQAREQAQRALALVENGPADAALVAQVTQLQAELDAEEKDRMLVAALDEAWLAQAETLSENNRFAHERAVPKFRDAFRAYGLPAGEGEPAPAAGRIRQRPPAVREAIVAALDEWTDLADTPMYQITEPHRAWLRAVVAAAEPGDAWTKELRLALAETDEAKRRTALEHLAAAVDVRQHPPRTLTRLAGRLQGVGPAGPGRRYATGPAAVALLRRAQRQYPADFWINEELGMALQNAELTEELRRAQRQYPADFWTNDELGVALQNAESKEERNEAVRFLTAAVALRPDRPGPLLNLGNALGRKGEFDEAIASYRKAIELDPKYAWPTKTWAAWSKGHWTRPSPATEGHRTDPKRQPANWAVG